MKAENPDLAQQRRDGGGAKCGEKIECAFWTDARHSPANHTTQICYRSVRFLRLTVLAIILLFNKSRHEGRRLKSRCSISDINTRISSGILSTSSDERASRGLVDRSLKNNY